MLHTTYMATALGSTQLSDSVVVCEGSFITEQQRYNFFPAQQCATKQHFKREFDALRQH